MDGDASRRRAIHFELRVYLSSRVNLGHQITLTNVRCKLQFTLRGPTRTFKLKSF